MGGSTLRIALRTLGRHRGFTIVAVLSLAIAIALNTTMYSALDALIYPKIAARKPENVYMFWYFGFRGLQMVNPSHTNVEIERAIRTGSRNLEDLSGFGGSSRWTGARSAAPLAENGSRYRRVSPQVVRANFFDFLGTRPLEGRTFRADDEREGYLPTVISERLAGHLFPGESPVGQTVTLDGRGFAVIGVVQRSTVFAPLDGDMWILRQPGAPPLRINLIRLKERIPAHMLRDELRLAAAQLAHAAGEGVSETGFRGMALKTEQFEFDQFHFALIGGVVAVLLVACANLANLQLARGLARSRELATRSAVGASRAQLIMLLLLETGILALTGLALGVVLTLWGIKLVTSSIPPIISNYLVEPQTSWRVFAFAAAASVVCLLLVGLVPALRISRVDPNELLKSGAGTGANRAHRRRYSIMVVAQIGLALPVFVAAIVILKEAVRLASPEILYGRYGYDPRPLLTARVPFVAPRGKMVRIGAVAAELVSRARTVPSVLEAAAFSGREPLRHRVTVDDEGGALREEPAHMWGYRIVSPTYFRATAQTIDRGRDFIDGEADGRYVIMDAPSAKFLWGDQDPLGRSIKFGPKDANLPWLRVVGVLKDPRDTATIRLMDYTTGYRLGSVYRVITPTDSVVLSEQAGAMSLRIRVRGNTELAAVRLQRELRSLQSVERPGVIPMMDDLGLAQQRERQDFVAWLFSTFAFLGLCLVAIGVYGIVSHSVAERRRELAVRISFGATARHVLQAVLREGNALILSGIAMGLLAVKYTVFWLARFIDGNDGYNALLFAGIAAVLFAIAALAAYIPALRATRIDPAEALRND
ncbi:MAG: ABC transporter permease [Gemmatimonadaceae bacterium]